MKAETREDFLKLLRAQQIVGDTIISDASIPQGYWDTAKALFLKHRYHATSAFYLSGRTHIGGICEPFTDFASIAVLVRAALESVLTFHYLFVSPTSDEEREFRHTAWLLSGFRTLQNYPCLLPESKKKKEQEKLQMGVLIEKLRNNAVFKGLERDQKKEVEKGRKWRVPSQDWSWKEIAKSMGLSDIMAGNWYSYLCGHAHSEGRSVWQVAEYALDEQAREHIAAGSFCMLEIGMAYMVACYTEVFREAAHKLALMDKSALDAVDKYIEMGKLLDNAQAYFDGLCST